MLEILQKNINEIKNLGWIPCDTKNYGNAGLKLEKLLNITPENFEIPDYGNIEIKTKFSQKENKISLFTATPDSYLFEIKRIHKLYAYPDRKSPNYKILNQEISVTKKTKIKENIYFKLNVCKKEREIKLLVYNKNEIIDSHTSWSFDMLQRKLERKLSYLCYIEIKKIYDHGQTYIKYTNDYYYKLKGFESFIDLIEKGKIKIVFRIGTFKSGKRKGQIHDHGTCFAIDNNNLEMLFNRVL